MNSKRSRVVWLASVLGAGALVNCSVETEGEVSELSQAAVSDCGSLVSWIGNDWRLSFSAGQIIEHDGERYQANQDISYPNSQCAPDAPVSWCADWFTHLGACGTDSGPVATCDDGVQNQGETGVDCGGPCEACEVPATCDDGVQNQGETGVDCGGPCDACEVPATCDDGVQNQGETGVDCGGPCDACEVPATCDDGVKNQGETDVDCGGPCAACVTDPGGGEQSQPGDCTRTSQCQQMYDGATDCKNNLGGVCYCGNSVCTSEGGGTGGGSGGTGDMLGKFEVGSDLLLCNYDQKPDEDDIHAVAGLATMLRDSRFAGVDYHCTAGAYGKQGGTFISEPVLFNMAFGANWSSAHSNWNGAVTTAFNKARNALNAGGDIWVTEAGQSDFTADVVRKIRAEMPGINTQVRVHVVQHSDWNENQTTAADLSYVKANTDYSKIDDGNSSNNATPGLHTSDGSQWGRATSDSEVGAIWTEARAAAQRWFGINWDNGAIKAGGMDFSDTVEPMWIFGFAGVNGGVKGFFDEFL